MNEERALKPVSPAFIHALAVKVVKNYLDQEGYAHIGPYDSTNVMQPAPDIRAMLNDQLLVIFVQSGIHPYVPELSSMLAQRGMMLHRSHQVAVAYASVSFQPILKEGEAVITEESTLVPDFEGLQYIVRGYAH